MWLEFRLLCSLYLFSIINGAKLNINDNDILKYEEIEPNNELMNLKNMKRVLVKRKVPHGSESMGLEYDKKLNMFYRPLMRIYDGKKVPLVPNDKVVKSISDLNGYLDGQSDNAEMKRDDSEKFPKKFDKALDLFLRLKKLREAPVDRTAGESSIVNKLYDKYKDVVFSLLDKQFGGDSQKKKEFLEKAVSKIKQFKDKKDLFFTLSKAFTTLRLLRTDEPQGGVDVKESIFYEQDELNQTEKPKVELPYIPYWNYWTYEKNLHLDNCKYGWVRYHDMCIELPPH